MRITSFVFVAPIMTFYNHHFNIANKHNHILTRKINHTVSSERRKIEIVVNKHKNRGIYKCYFCLGSGYVECDKCSKEHCVQCEYTGFKKCHICGGSGKGGPRYMFCVTPRISDLDTKFNQ